MQNDFTKDTKLLLCILRIYGIHCGVKGCVVVHECFNLLFFTLLKLKVRCLKKLHKGVFILSAQC